MRLRVALGAAAVVVGYRWFVEPWHRTWGATSAEAAGALPGDELTAAPAEQATRAITIDAPADRVWPWIIQLGADRGGFYSYDWLEDVFGLRIHSAEEIVPAWQHLEVGDVVYADRARTGGWIVLELVPGRTLVMKVADIASARPIDRGEGPGWEFQWTFSLQPVGEDRTRLLVRERVGFGRRTTRWLMAPVGVVSFVMTRKMLVGIKQRAEASRRVAGEDVQTHA
jgi:hypothetical protein